MKKQLLIFLILLTNTLLFAQTQINTITDFADFEITDYDTIHPVIKISTHPVSLTGNNCAKGIFQKLHLANVTYDSIVATYTIKTSNNSTIKDVLYNNFFPVGVSYRRRVIKNYDRLNPVHHIEFCGQHDTITFSDLLILGYGPHTTGISSINEQLEKHIYSFNKSIFIKDLNLEGLWVSIYDLSSRNVFFEKAAEAIELDLHTGFYILTIQDKQKNCLATKKLNLY